MTIIILDRRYFNMRDYIKTVEKSCERIVVIDRKVVW
jgi:hypothetical protein